MDTILIACNATYDDRKSELERFASEQRMSHAPMLVAA